MWNQLLDEAKSERKFENTPVIVLGSKHSGKRSLIDSLFDISKTTIHSKRLTTNHLSGKMKLKGLAPVLDYAYLNVLDLNDPDYRTHSKLEIYMVEDTHNHEVIKQLQKPQLLKKAVVVIMLDFTNPWDFIDQLNGWVRFLQQLQIRAGLSIIELEEMSKKVELCYNGFKEVEFDENGQLKKQFNAKEEELNFPITEGVLTNNLRMPIILCANKCDLQSAVLRDESANKLQFVLYHLRQFCLTYGGSLIYTSIKNNANINLLYEYILHRAYSMPLRFKPQIINEEAVFVPLGYDSPTLLQDSVLKMDISKPYSQVIPVPTLKKAVKEEIIIEEDSEFFKKYFNASSSSVSTLTINESSSMEESSISSKPKPNQATNFFMKLLNSSNSQQQSDKKTVEAQNSLLKHTKKQINMSKQIKAKQ